MLELLLTKPIQKKEIKGFFIPRKRLTLLAPPSKHHFISFLTGRHTFVTVRLVEAVQISKEFIFW